MQLLFMCPHGAAKSVMATAIARDLIEKRGVTVGCANAGTEPDPENSRFALDELNRHGLGFDDAPRLVAPQMIDEAALVVILGDMADDLPSTPRRLVDWSDVPNASTDAAGLHAILQERVRGLLDGLDI